MSHAELYADAALHDATELANAIDRDENSSLYFGLTGTAVAPI